MHKLWEKSTAYNVFKAYVDLCTRTSFRKFRIEGKENIPYGVPVIFASNHRAALMDPLVLLVKGKDPISYGCRADLFRKPWANKALRWLRIVPLARERDGMKAVAGNAETFNEVTECLLHGVPFCLYVEGTHFPDREMHPVKKGVFRIAEQTAENTGDPVYIVPVGLDYESFHDFMRDCTVRFGEPICTSDLKGLSSIEMCELLRGRVRELFSAEEPSRKRGNIVLRILLGAVLSPIFAVCFAASSPILLVTWLLTRKLEDKAWMNTIRFACRLPLIVLWPFHSLFYLLKNFYSDIFKDL